MLLCAILIKSVYLTGVFKNSKLLGLANNVNPLQQTRPNNSFLSFKIKENIVIPFRITAFYSAIYSTTSKPKPDNE